MSAADFVHHDDALAAAHAEDHTVAPAYRPRVMASLPHVTSEELRASREELLAALDAERAANAVAWGLVDDLFDRLKGRHRTTTPTKETK